MAEFAALCLTARGLGYHVQLKTWPGGPAVITDKPTRLSAIRVADGDDEEIGFKYIHPQSTLDKTAALLLEEMRNG